MRYVKADRGLAASPYSLAEAVRRYSMTQPGATAINDRGFAVSYRELEGSVATVAQLLTSLGAEAGSIVWSLLSRCLDFVVLFIAAQRLHAILVPLSSDTIASSVRRLAGELPPAAVAYHLSQTRPLNKVLQALRLRRSEKVIISDSLALQRVAPIARPFAPAMTTAQLVPGSYVNFTSGTTSPSKGAACSSTNIFWNTQAAIHCLNLRQADIHFSTFPVHIHPHEIFARALYLGGTAVLMDFTELCSDLDQVNRLGVTCLMSTPALLDAILRRQQAQKVLFRSLRLAESGGGLTPPALIKAWHDHNSFPPTPVWGSAETTGIALVNPAPLDEAKLLQPITPYYRAQIVNGGKPAARGKSGELRLSGRAIAQCYVSKAPSGQGAFRDGWYYTGDFFRMVSRSQFLFEHRATDVIKPKGMTVFPSDVENVLRQIEGVRDAIVVGIQHERKGELLAACIVWQDISGTPSVRRIVQLCKRKLPPFSIPQRFEFLDELPRDDAGKISRRMVGELITTRIRRQSKPTN